MNAADTRTLVARVRRRAPRRPLDMAELSYLDQVHLVIDTVDHLPHAGDKGIYLKQQLQDKTSRTQAIHRQTRQGSGGNTPLELEDNRRRTTEVSWSAVAPLDEGFD